jgi:hypothetical protein
VPHTTISSPCARRSAHKNVPLDGIRANEGQNILETYREGLAHQKWFSIAVDVFSTRLSARKGNSSHYPAVFRRVGVLLAGTKTILHQCSHLFPPTLPSATVPHVADEAFKQQPLTVIQLEFRGEVSLMSEHHIVRGEDSLVKIEHLLFDEAERNCVLRREHDEEWRRCFDIYVHYGVQAEARR